MNPKVTVLMAVYNGEKYLKEAIDSIISQTFSDFEFLIINDGSTDESVEIISSYTDKRIRLVNNELNMGLVDSLNRGIDQAIGEYIARMDCDDISLPRRLEKQVQFMDENPEVAICGTWCRVFGDKQKGVWKYPLSESLIRAELLFSCAMAHPSVIMRKQPIDFNGLRYSESYLYAEDYELWVRAADLIKLVNLGEILINYRVHADQVGEKYTVKQRKTAGRIRRKLLNKLHIEPTADEIDLHQSIGNNEYKIDREFIEKAELWLRKILMANKRHSVYQQEALNLVLGKRWYNVCRSSVSLGLWVYSAFVSSPLSLHCNKRIRQTLGLWARCIIYEAMRYGNNQ